MTTFEAPRSPRTSRTRSSPTPQPRRRVKRKTINTIIWFVVLLALTAIVLYPRLWMVVLVVQAVERVRRQNTSLGPRELRLSTTSSRPLEGIGGHPALAVLHELAVPGRDGA